MAACSGSGRVRLKWPPCLRAANQTGRETVEPSADLAGFHISWDCELNIRGLPLLIQLLSVSPLACPEHWSIEVFFLGITERIALRSRCSSHTTATQLLTSLRTASQSQNPECRNFCAVHSFISAHQGSSWLVIRQQYRTHGWVSSTEINLLAFPEKMDNHTCLESRTFLPQMTPSLIRTFEQTQAARHWHYLLMLEFKAQDELVLLLNGAHKDQEGQRKPSATLHTNVYSLQALLGL